MTQFLRAAAIMLLVGLIGACVRLGHVQQNQPVRTLQFKGSPQGVAQCIHQRLGGKVQQEAFGDSFVVYDSVKGLAHEGLTHYAITVRRISAEDSVAEWRIMGTPRYGTGTGAYPPPKLSEDTARQFWTPVQDCVRSPLRP
jgi:hypothetical protein